MTFKEFWELVGKQSMLSKEAFLLVPDTLSTKTKSRLCGKKPEEAAEIVLWAINQIDHGSVETVDVLVNRRL